MSESFENLPLFTGVKIKKTPVNKISFLSNKNHSDDNLFSKKEIPNKQKIEKETIYCENVVLGEKEQENNKVSPEDILLDKKLSKTIDKYNFKSPFLKI